MLTVSELAKQAFDAMQLPSHAAMPDDGLTPQPSADDYPHQALRNVPGFNVPNYVYPNNVSNFTPEKHYPSPVRPTGIVDNRFKLPPRISVAKLPSANNGISGDIDQAWRPPLATNALQGPTIQMLNPIQGEARTPEADQQLQQQIVQHQKLQEELRKHKQLTTQSLRGEPSLITFDDLRAFSPDQGTPPSPPTVQALAQRAAMPDVGSPPMPYRDQPIPRQTVVPDQGTPPSPPTVQALAQRAAMPDVGSPPMPYRDQPIPRQTVVPDIGMPPTTYKDMPMPANAVLPDAGIPPFGTQGVGSMFKRMGQQATGTVADLGRRAATGFQTGMNQLQKADQLAGSYYPRIPRSSVPADGNYVKPETEAAFNSFNQEAARVAPPIDRGKIISDRIQENLANASLQGRQQANSRVDANLARTAQLGRTLGGADYRQAARQGVVPQRGMGPLPSDAARKPPAPLGDGGAARRAADAAKARMRAGTTVWGAPTYTPAPELATAAGSSAPMTTFELQFNRHKHNMANNPAYANRINAQRQQRTAQLERRNSFKLGGKPNGITS